MKKNLKKKFWEKSFEKTMLEKGFEKKKFGKINYKLQQKNIHNQN